MNHWMGEEKRKEYEEHFSPDGEKIQHDMDFPQEDQEKLEDAIDEENIESAEEAEFTPSDGDDPRITEEDNQYKNRI